MFQIFDCIGRAVGRPEGYKKHITAQRLAERPGRIKTALWEAYHSHYDHPTDQDPATGTRLVYRVAWQGVIESPILASEKVISKYDGRLHGGVEIAEVVAA
jgi:hypothetical protein